MENEEKISYPKRKSSPGTSEYLLETIRDMHGFSEKEINNPENIEKIELVLEELYTLNGISLFCNLKSLTLINVNIKKIEFLNNLQQLTELWLNENEISQIEGLKGLTNLRNLYICFNKIAKISGLDSLQNLEVLWLCGNEISKIEHVKHLENLKELNLGGNFVEFIKDSLDGLNKLQDLNISGNKIGTFKDALNLNRLPKLRTLAFYDPHFGENPICNLCNYQTYILYNFEKIERLDTLQISEDAKSFAQATFMKKKMYYTMRIKTIQRNFSMLLKSVKLAKLLKLERVQRESLAFAQKTDDSSRLISHEQKLFEDLKGKVSRIIDFSIRKLLIELDTGGNIRLEEGKGNEKWYISCVDLIKSRFFAEEMQKTHEIVDIHVNRVIRIHNRFLRNKFEEKMELFIDSQQENYKKSLEYLFFGLDALNLNQIFHVVEEGFTSFSEENCKSFNVFPTLFNSILAADCPRLLDLLRKSLKNKENLTFVNSLKFEKGLMIVPSGMLVICKVFMLKSVRDERFSTFELERSPIETLKMQPIEFSNNIHSVYRVNGNDEKHKMWFICDNNLVLPEYLVEFQYTTKYEKNNRMTVFDSQNICELTNSQEEFITQNNFPNYAEKFNEIFDDFTAKICEKVENNSENKHHVELKSIDLDRAELNCTKLPVLNYLKYAFSLNKNDNSENLLQIDFSAQNLANSNEIISKTSHFSNKILYMNLSFNKLALIDDLLELSPCLKHLNVSHNFLTKLKTPSKTLEFLDISHNHFSNLTQVLNENSFANSLVYFNTKGNPLEINESFELLNKLAKLQFFNGKFFEKIVKNSQFLSETLLTDDKIYESSRFFHDFAVEKDKEKNWKNSVESLNLSRLKLRTTDFSSSSSSSEFSLKNLRRLDLSFNRLEKITGLEAMPNLEELNLTKNNISRICGLSQLFSLRILELGMNYITKIEGLETLQNLLQLSLEDNRLTSLHEFPELLNLLELYLGNNLIANPKEIPHLKPLKKLIILDISGNPVAKDPNHRVFTLYNLKKLKVLDGVSVEIAEYQTAKDLFTGRLTEEILLSRLQGTSPETVRELDLTNCKLKDFEDVFDEKYFPSLVELNLSVNLFASVKMLGNLPKLKVLVLNSNKIESLSGGLTGCAGLEILDLSNNCLKDLCGLNAAGLKNLKILKTDHNEITKLDSFETLEQLKDLDLNNNKIRQIDANAFSGNNPIKCLKIEENSLKNFANLQKLYKLQHLFASNNRINELQDIEKLSELQSLKELELNGNALSKRPGYRQAIIKKLPFLLYLDGKEITNEEREKIDNPSQGLEKNLIPGLFIQNPASKVPVKISAINFEGVFGNVRFPSDNNPNIYKKY